MFKINPAEPKDLPLLLAFIKELAVYEKLSHEVSATEELLEKYLFSEDKVAEAVIGTWEGKPVAFALFFFTFSTFLAKPSLYLEDLFVQSEYRNKGFGKQLFLYLGNYAKQKSCGRFEWWVLDWNKPAIEFYKSMGAIPMDDWTTYRLTGKSLENL